VPSKIN